MKIINVTSITTFIDLPFISLHGERYMADLYINVDQISHFKRGNEETNNFHPTLITMLNGSQLEVAETPEFVETLIAVAGGGQSPTNDIEEDYIQPIKGGYSEQAMHVICSDGEMRWLDGFLAVW